MRPNWKRSQWTLAIFLTVGITAFFISASALKARMEHPAPTSKYRNLTPSVRTLVVETGWNNLKIVLGNESQRHDLSPNNSNSIRPEGFLRGITDCSVELFNPVGVAEGLLKQVAEQRGDTLFIRKPDQHFPGLLRLNLPALSELNIISREDIRLFTFSDDQAATLDHLQFKLSGMAEVRVDGALVKTLSVTASDEAHLLYRSNLNDFNIALQVTVEGQDRSLVQVSGFFLDPNKIDLSLHDEAVFINSPIRTYTAWGSLANEQ